jgi:ATP-binding cassette subfamily G (WHITE) protein 2 (SNQ2)
MEEDKPSSFSSPSDTSSEIFNPAKRMHSSSVSNAVSTLLRSQSGDNGAEVKTASLSFEDLSVQSPGDTVHPVKTLPRAILNTFGPDQYNFIKSKFASWFPRKSNGKQILTDFTGLLHPGEMLFVLGRPGSGCSTFLRTAANRSSLQVTGQLGYGNMTAEEFGKNHERETVYLPEEDKHIATLSVRQTLQFALRTSLPAKTRTPALVNELVEAIAGILGLTHALETGVGGAFVPGVSGGERKRYVPTLPKM